MLCPCGSELNYLECCGQYIERKIAAPNPLVLMKSRYTAYTLGNIDYIQNTMQGLPLKNFSMKDVKEWALSVKWLNLIILKVDDSNNQVEFIARYIEKKRIHQLHEISQFEFDGKNWFYTDGKIIPTQSLPIPLNSPCFCGSQKKYKNCHGKS